jgi:hypothetical protein
VEGPVCGFDEKLFLGMYRRVDKKNFNLLLAFVKDSIIIVNLADRAK